MASSIAKAVVGSKVKEVTKGIEGAVGLDEKQNTAAAEAATQRELWKRQEKRDQEKRELHKQKEGERKNIRDKYQLPKSTSDSKKLTEQKPTESKQDSTSCSVC